jgi:predicted transcriptional regulator
MLLAPPLVIDAHMHARMQVMRTTVELSDPLYRRVRALAAARGERGFSPIVEIAVREYLDREAVDTSADDAFAAARGAWSDEEADRFSAELRDAWSTWTQPRS